MKSIIHLVSVVFLCTIWILQSAEALGGFTQNARIEYFPFHAIIEYKSKYRCTGAIISPKYVLAADSCMNILCDDPNDPILDMKIRVGATDKNSKEGSEHLIKSYFNDKMDFYHDVDDVPEDELDLKDLALIEVNPPIHLDDKREMTKYYKEPISDGSFLQLSGWSFEKDRNCESSLQATSAIFLAGPKCNMEFNEKHDDSMFCTVYDYDKEEDRFEANKGDLLSVDGLLVGIVIDNDCCRKTAQRVVYKNVSNFFESAKKSEQFQEMMLSVPEPEPEVHPNAVV